MAAVGVGGSGAAEDGTGGAAEGGGGGEGCDCLVNAASFTFME